MNDYRLKTEVLVIGSGIAGTTCALGLAEAGHEVTLITAGEQPDGGNTALAQGGIVYKAPDDDPKILENDILTAGWKENYLKAVRYLSRRGPQVLRQVLLDRYSVPFETTSQGDWHLTREGGHTLPRILFSADHTGHTIMDALLRAVEEHENIRLLTRRTAIDLLTTHHHSSSLNYRYSLNNQCVGAYVFNDHLDQIETILADSTVLATGGAGQVYLHTTNTSGSIGSGLAMGYRAGARILNAEYVQFHPTALYQKGSKRSRRRFLVSEAVRGEGARLVNSAGEAFMQRYDQRADLAPRDIVTRAIMEEMLQTGDHCVYLDVSTLSQDPAKRFPTIYERCQNMGVDMHRHAVPVVPAAHYFCGGVLVNVRGRTTLDRLYAAGECTCTGVHGANRLASTSLLEGVLWGQSAAEDIHKRQSKSFHLSKRLMDSIPDWQRAGDIRNEDPALIAQDWTTIRSTMWNYVGITRSADRLNRAFSDLRKLFKNLQDFYKKTHMSKPIIDLFHGSQAAYSITLSAMRNKSSKGCHHRVD